MVMQQSAPAQAGGQQQAASWLTEAQLRQQPVGSIAYDGGSGTVRFLDLPQAGYLSRLNLVTTVNGTLSAAPTAIDQFASVQGLLQQIRVFVNTEGEMFDLDGFMAAVVQAIDDTYHGYDAQFGVNSLASFSVNPGTGAFSNKWLHRIPLGLTLDNIPYPLGLYNTALQNLSIRLQLRFLPIAAATGLIPGAADYLGTGLTVSNITGQTDVNEEYFEPIPIASAQPPLRYIHRWTQFEVPIGVTNGTVDVPLPGRQRYLRMIYAVLDGTSGNVVLNPNILTQLQLTYGVQSHPFDETVDQVNKRMRDTYGRLMNSFPAGVYTHDFITREHTARDWFNAGLTTNLRAQLTFSGAHPGTGSKIICATEELLTLRQAGFNNTAAALAGG